MAVQHNHQHSIPPSLYSATTTMAEIKLSEMRDLTTHRKNRSTLPNLRLGLDSTLEARQVSEGMVDQTSDVIVKIVPDGEIAGRGVHLASQPRTIKTAIVMGMAISKERMLKYKLTGQLSPTQLQRPGNRDGVLFNL